MFMKMPCPSIYIEIKTFMPIPKMIQIYAILGPTVTINHIKDKPRLAAISLTSLSRIRALGFYAK